MSSSCPKCGAVVPESAKFCPECGAKIEATKKIAPEAKKSGDATREISSHRAFRFIYFVALISIIIVAIYGYKYIVPPSAPAQDPHTRSTVAPEKPMMDQTVYNELKSKWEANPNGLKENIDLGNFLFDNQCFSEAISYYEKAVELNPGDADVIVDLGVCYFNMQELQKSKEYFQKALKINDKHPNALYNLGVVSAQLGNMDELIQYWEKLIEVAPESGSAQMAKQMLDQVKSSMKGNN